MTAPSFRLTYPWRTLLVLAAVLCSGRAGAQTLDQLHALAKAEQSLVLWAAGPTAPYERAARAFEQQYPGITVSLTGGFINVLNAQMEEKFRIMVECDVAIFQTVQ